MTPITVVHARIRIADVEAATAAAAPEFTSRVVGSSSADPTIAEVHFRIPSESDTAEAMRHGDSAVLKLEVRLEAAGIWHEIHGVSASGTAQG